MEKIHDVLSSLCEAAGKHHGEMIDHHESAIAAHEDAMEECEKVRASEQTHHVAFHEASIASHKDAIKSHLKMKKRYEHAMEECEKTSRTDDLTKLAPDRVSGIAWGVQPVIRPGQPQLGKAAGAEVDPQIAHIIPPVEEIEQDA